MPSPFPPGPRPGAAALALLLSALPACKALEDAADRLKAGFQRPTAEVVGAHLAHLDLEGAELSFEVLWRNPLGVEVPLADVAYTLTSQGRSLVEGEGEMPGALPARGERTVEVPARVVFADLLSVLSDVRPGAVVPYEAELKLALFLPGAGRVEVPVRHSGDLPIPALPRVRLARLDVQETSLTRVAFSIALAVTNENTFPLDLNDGTLGLTLGGAEVASLRWPRTASLEPGASGELEFPFEVRLADAGGALLDMLRSGRVDYRLVGALKAATPFGALDLPLDVGGEAAVGRAGG